MNDNSESTDMPVAEGGNLPPPAEPSPAFHKAVQPTESEPQPVVGEAPPAPVPLSDSLMLRHVFSDRPTAPKNAYPHHYDGCALILLSFYNLFALDDRAAWERDLIHILLAQESGSAAGDPPDGQRVKRLVTGFDLFFRLFGLRDKGLSFRHQREKFDMEFFLHLVPPRNYVDDWFEDVEPDVIAEAESFLNRVGILELKQITSCGESFACLRIRADLLVRVLVDAYPDRYAGLDRNPFQ